MPTDFRIAAVVTTCFPRSHASVLLSKFLYGFNTDEGLLAPRTKLASLYIDQIHEQDIGLQLARAFDIRVYQSIRAALTLGGAKLAVDGVLLIGEHGDYPLTSLGQEMLPRRWFFEQIAGVMGQSGRCVPLFNDKHLAYRWLDAREMFETARDLKIPLWAGSAVPVSWRCPQWEHPAGDALDEAVAIGFHMPERYGFHALESLQCQVERRRGGETGVESVQCLAGQAVWDAGRESRWSWELAERALAAIEGGPGKLEPQRVPDPLVYLIDYRDGLKAAILMLGDSGYVSKFAFAGRSGRKVDAIEYHTSTGPSNGAFSYLALNIEDFLLSGQPPSPLERTLLTTGMLEAAMISRHQGGQPVLTGWLDISYAPQAGPPRRPKATRPTGASLDPAPLPEPGATPAAEPIPIGRDGTVRKRPG